MFVSFRKLLFIGVLSTVAMAAKGGAKKGSSKEVGASKGPSKKGSSKGPSKKGSSKGPSKKGSPKGPSKKGSPKGPSKKGSPKVRSDWRKGDLFLGVGGGKYKVYDDEGIFKEEIDDGFGGFTTQCAFNKDKSELFTLSFSSRTVVAFDIESPHDIVQKITTTGGAPEGIALDKYGNFYVGSQGYDTLLKYNAMGTLLDSFSLSRNHDHIDLAADQKTLFYANQGDTIYRYDLENESELPNFATVPSVSGTTQDLAKLRLLPPGDGSGGLLVASYSDIKRLDADGNIIQTYDAPPGNLSRRWYSLILDQDGCSFWAGDLNNAELYRFGIESGEIEVGPIDAGVGQTRFAGLCQLGEQTAAVHRSKNFKVGKKCKKSKGPKKAKKGLRGGESVADTSMFVPDNAIATETTEGIPIF